MSTGNRGPRRPQRPRTPQQRDQQARSGRPARPGRGRSRGRVQSATARNRTMIGVAIGAALLIVVAIVIVVAAVRNNGGGGSASATQTPAAGTTGSSASGAPIPTTVLGASSSPSAEVAASKTACAPFLAAAQQPQSGKKQWGSAPKQVIDPAKHYQVKIYTDKGVVTADILPKLAPVTANNFIFLSCEGFYDGTIFHRTIPTFMIQGGDPTGTGTGGPGYQFNDEKVARPYQIGDLAMANSGANTNGSQFFVIQGSQGTGLPQSYNLFGHVTKGQNVVDAIAAAPTHAGSSGENSSPNTPVHIRTITVQVS